MGATQEQSGSNLAGSFEYDVDPDEIEQAYLEATHEGGSPELVEGEIDDLGPLLLQLVESLRNHPWAFEPLPTAEEVDE